MAKGPEAKVQKRIQDGLKKAYPESFFFKSHGGSFQQSGLPDLMGTIDGIFIGIEVKTPDKKENVTKLQLHCLDQITKAGGIGFVSWSIEHTLETLKVKLREYYE